MQLGPQVVELAAQRLDPAMLLLNVGDRQRRKATDVDRVVARVGRGARLDVLDDEAEVLARVAGLALERAGDDQGLAQRYDAREKRISAS